MPLVAHTRLPTFQRLAEEGEEILERDRACHQDIRELHIGLLNMMPDAALQSTERQFMRLVGSCNRIAQFYVHPFSFSEIERSPKAKAYIGDYYEDFKDIKTQGLDALIVTGANPKSSDITQETFWQPLTEALDWARENVTSVLCACLATHATLKYFHDIDRVPMGHKRWGVFPHNLNERAHPLVRNINTRFDVPHSRWNDISQAQLQEAGIHVLAESAEAGVHLAVSEDLFRFVYFQGHPEYDRNSLLKEYKREVLCYLHGELETFPPYPKYYFSPQILQMLENFRQRALVKRDPSLTQYFPEEQVHALVDNTWSDTGKSVVNNWVGLVYQKTHRNRRIPFMEGIDPQDPLGRRR